MRAVLGPRRRKQKRHEEPRECGPSGADSPDIAPIGYAVPRVLRHSIRTVAAAAATTAATSTTAASTAPAACDDVRPARRVRRIAGERSVDEGDDLATTTDTDIEDAEKYAGNVPTRSGDMPTTCVRHGVPHSARDLRKCRADCLPSIRPNESSRTAGLAMLRRERERE